MIALSICLTAIASYAVGFAVGRLPAMPRTLSKLPLPGARVVLDRRRDQRADITVAIGDGFARRLP